MGAGERVVLSNQRLEHLDALRAAVDARRESACGLVEVGCDFVRAAWWFTWSDGRPIGPVSNVLGVLDALVRELR